MTTTDGPRVTGARVRDRDGELAQVPADLVMEATGAARGSRGWRSGATQPPTEDRIDIGLGYATRTYRLRPGALGEDLVIGIGGTLDNPRPGALAALEATSNAGATSR
jgi:hypothetical protein